MTLVSVKLNFVLFQLYTYVVYHRFPRSFLFIIKTDCGP